MPFSFSSRWQDLEYCPNPLTEALAVRRNAGLPILDLTVSNPTQCGIAASENWTALLNQPEVTHYDPQLQGNLKVREAIVRYYAERGEIFDPSDFFLTSSTSEGYSHLFKLLCDPGDEVLIPSPSYPLLETLASLNGIALKTYSLVQDSPDGDEFIPWKLDRTSLESALTEKTRALIVVQPNNPTGSVLSNDDAEYLRTLADQRGLALIVDEVFADYCFDIPAARTGNPRGYPYRTASLVFTLNGLSKILGLPQLKLAWIHVSGNSDLKIKAKSHLEWICDAYLSVNAATQAACPELLRRRVEFQDPIKARLSENLATLREFGKTNPRVEPLWPQGGWCIPIHCKDVEDDEEFALTLLRNHGVLVHPGYFFDFTEENIVVVSLLTPRQIFREGLRAFVSTSSTTASQPV